MPILRHSDPVYRVFGFTLLGSFLCMMAALILLAPIYGLTPGIQRFVGFTFLLGALSMLGIFGLKHLRRARHMMEAEGGEGGYARAAGWAFRNGDFAIKLAYVSLVLTLGVFIFAAVGPQFESSFSRFTVVGFLLASIASLLRDGHVGRARFLPSRAVTWRPSGLIVLIAGLMAIKLLMIGLMSSRAFVVASIPLLGMIYVMFLMGVDHVWSKQRQARNKHFRLVMAS